MDRASQIGMALTAFGVSASMFDRVLPPINEVRKETCDRHDVQDIRKRVGRTTGVMLAVGGGISLLTRSPWPVVGVIGAAIWLVGEYEAAAAAPGKETTAWR